jgi:undecaprenyl-diphosphatase
MSFIEAVILGIIQGLTEFLPVSSSGHLEIGKALLGVNMEGSLVFTVVVHGATVLSTLVVFYQEIVKLLKDGAKFQYNESTAYIFKILLSMIPVLLVGLLWKDQIESLFTGNLVFVGSMLLVTSLLLGLTFFIKKDGVKKIHYLDAFIIGLAQALAVIPGISRSGATISTGVLLGNKREDIAKFSFLMVLLPIIGANLMDVLDGSFTGNDSLPVSILLIGFIAAFVSGLLACKLMINIVKKGKLIYFALYCFVIGMLTIIFA